MEPSRRIDVHLGLVATLIVASCTSNKGNDTSDASVFTDAGLSGGGAFRGTGGSVTSPVGSGGFGASAVGSGGFGASVVGSGGFTNGAGGSTYVPIYDASPDHSVIQCAGGCPANTACDTSRGACVSCVDNPTACGIVPDSGTGTTKEGGAAVVSCSADGDCAANAGATKCDPALGRCVECRSSGTTATTWLSSDCNGDSECVRGLCVPFTRCANSLGCQSGKICDTSGTGGAGGSGGSANTGRCVDCTKSADCPEEMKCSNYTCKRTCTSDKQCTPFGLLCDTANGVCASCVSHTDCLSNQYCYLGVCYPDICAADTSRCKSTSSVVTCDKYGSQIQTSFCSSSESCVASGSTAACHSRLCTPGATSCGSNDVLVCTADGMSQTTKEECGAVGKICYQGSCLTQTCTAGEYTCTATGYSRCNTSGTGWDTVQTCTSNQYCDNSTTTPSCKTKVCTPNQMGCANSTTAAMCNDKGSGYTSDPPTNCVSPNAYCVNGACSASLFAESFENMGDGGALTWTRNVSTSSTYPNAATVQPATPGAKGTNTALALVSGTTNYTTYFDGIYQTFTSPLTPSSVSFWIKADSSSSSYSPYVVLSQSGASTSVGSSVSTSSSYAITMYVSGSYIYVYSYGYDCYYSGYATGTWERVRLAFDWVNHTITPYFSVMGDGGETAPSTASYCSYSGSSGGYVPFYSSFAISRIDLFAKEYGSSGYVSYFDEIEFLP